MMLPFLLVPLGLLLIFLEFYLPGAVLGILGGLILFAAIILFSMEVDSFLLIILFSLGILILLWLDVKFAIWKIRTEKKGRGIYSFDDQEGYSASSFDKETIGKKGVAHTDLKPGGQIIVEGKRYGALSLSGYLVKGTSVIVTGGEGESLLVKKENV